MSSKVRPVLSVTSGAADPQGQRQALRPVRLLVCWAVQPDYHFAEQALALLRTTAVWL